ncbi:MAG: serine hydrolase [Bacteroidota bacterium]
MAKQVYLLLLSLVLIVACSSENSEGETSIDEQPVPTNLYFPPANAPDWATVSASQLDWNTGEEDALRSFLDDNGTKAFMILKNGRIVLEWYFDEHTQNTSWYWASAGKTLTAFTVGIAQEQGFLDIDNPTSDYLGEAWTAIPANKEALITVKHQLTMTSGLNEGEFECYDPSCLTYVSDAGTRWAYHNGPYTLLQQVVANATEEDWQAYFNAQLRDKVGMDGFWFNTDPNNIFFSTARSMARFGILNLNNGVWDGETILGDVTYRTAMKNSSQSLNPAYGYLWWLNGKDTFMAPGVLQSQNGNLVPNAPADLYAGLGKNDQKLYIVPSSGLVIVRMGEDSGADLLGPSSFDNDLWGRLSAYISDLNP